MAPEGSNVHLILRSSFWLYWLWGCLRIGRAASDLIIHGAYLGTSVPSQWLILPSDCSFCWFLRCGPYPVLILEMKLKWATYSLISKIMAEIISNWRKKKRHLKHSCQLISNRVAKDKFFSVEKGPCIPVSFPVHLLFHSFFAFFSLQEKKKVPHLTESKFPHIG